MKLKNINEVNSAITRLVYVRGLVSKNEQEIAILRDAIQLYMTENQLSMMETAEAKATFTRYKTKRFNATRFKSEHEKLYKQYVEEHDAERFTCGLNAGN